MRMDDLEQLTTLISRAGASVDRMNAAAHDLWSWLPSRKIAERRHGDEAYRLSTPSVGDVLYEATEVFAWLIHGPRATDLFDCPCGECDPTDTTEAAELVAGLCSDKVLLDMYGPVRGWCKSDTGSGTWTKWLGPSVDGESTEPLLLVTPRGAGGRMWEVLHGRKRVATGYETSPRAAMVAAELVCKDVVS